MKTRNGNRQGVLDLDERNRRASIVTQSGGILPYCDPFYNLSILYLARQSQYAFKRYRDDSSDQDASPDKLIATMQSAVGFAAALSRYFWPSVSKRARATEMGKLRLQRGKKLRTTFVVAEDSPLADRELRNAWEHFDERLDDYLLSYVAGVFLPNGIIGDHRMADDPTGHVFKLLDPEKECLVLLNEKFFFAPIRSEIERIVEVVAASIER